MAPCVCGRPSSVRGRDLRGLLKNRADKSVCPTLGHGSSCLSVARTLLSALSFPNAGVFQHTPPIAGGRRPTCDPACQSNSLSNARPIPLATPFVIPCAVNGFSARRDQRRLVEDPVLQQGTTDKQILRLFGESACPCLLLADRRKTRTRKTEQNAARSSLSVVPCCITRSFNTHQRSRPHWAANRPRCTSPGAETGRPQHRAAPTGCDARPTRKDFLGMTHT